MAARAKPKTTGNPAPWTGRVEVWSIERVKPYAANAKRHPPEQVAQLRASLRRFGWTMPLLVTAAGELVAGHGRVLAAEAEGFTEVPVIVRDDLTDEEARAYRLADNRLTEIGEWDDDLLRAELAALAALDVPLDGMGWVEDEIARLFDETEGDAAAGGTSGGEAGKPEVYSRKIEAPIYEPKGDKPDPAELYDATKAEALIAAIDAADLPADVAAFLRRAAERHVVFNFRRVADFYAHADAPTQRLMEASALVIIDFGQAIEHGFVKLTKRMGEIVGREYPEGEGDEDEDDDDDGAA